jgi:hypothetical protein
MMDEDTFFWIAFATFAIGETFVFWLMGVFDTVTTVGGVVILTIMFLLIGAALRYWVKRGMHF